MIEIKNRLSFEVIFKSDKSTIREAVEDASRRGANLRSADLRYANIEGINLEDDGNMKELSYV